MAHVCSASAGLAVPQLRATCRLSFLYVLAPIPTGSSLKTSCSAVPPDDKSCEHLQSRLTPILLDLAFQKMGVGAPDCQLPLGAG